MLICMYFQQLSDCWIAWYRNFSSSIKHSFPSIRSHTYSGPQLALVFAHQLQCKKFRTCKMREYCVVFIVGTGLHSWHQMLQKRVCSTSVEKKTSYYLYIDNKVLDLAQCRWILHWSSCKSKPLSRILTPALRCSTLFFVREMQIHWFMVKIDGATPKRFIGFFSDIHQWDLHLSRWISARLAR